MWWKDLDGLLLQSYFAYVPQYCMYCKKEIFAGEHVVFCQKPTHAACAQEARVGKA